MAGPEKSPAQQEAEKAALLEQTRLKAEQEAQEREERARMVEDMKDSRKKTVVVETRQQEEQLEVALPPENILKDEKKVGEIFDLKLANTPRNIPAFLFAVAEKNPTLLQNPVIIQVLAEKIQTLLQTVAKDSSLSGDRDWMERLRQSIQRVIIDPDLYKKMDSYGTMDKPLREKLQNQL